MKMTFKIRTTGVCFGFYGYDFYFQDEGSFSLRLQNRSKFQALTRRCSRGAIAFAAWLLCVNGVAQAADADADQDDRITRLEATVEALTDELEKAVSGAVVPDSDGASFYGLGPAASKVYEIDRGLSIGGYGEAYYSKKLGDDTNSENDITDFYRMVLYAGYKFNDWIVLNSEIEFEHGGSAAGGSVGVEFATLDFMLRDWVNVRAGLMLVPMGFINEMHEPVTYFGNFRPRVEQTIIPSTWRENGVGLYGTLAEGLTYKLYAMNGFEGADFRGQDGFRKGRQKGGKAIANNGALVARVDWTPSDAWDLGASFYYGDSGQDDASIPALSTTIWDIHVQYQGHGARVRGLVTGSNLDGAAEFNAAKVDPTNVNMAKEMLGAYGEIGYDVMQWIRPGSRQSLEPFYRFSYLDLQHEMDGADVANSKYKDMHYHTVGVSYKPIPQVVVKLDYRNISSAAGDDSYADEFNVGIGFVF